MIYLQTVLFLWTVCAYRVCAWTEILSMWHLCGFQLGICYSHSTQRFSLSEAPASLSQELHYLLKENINCFYACLSWLLLNFPAYSFPCLEFFNNRNSISMNWILRLTILPTTYKNTTHKLLPPHTQKIRGKSAFSINYTPEPI